MQVAHRKEKPFDEIFYTKRRALTLKKIMDLSKEYFLLIVAIEISTTQKRRNDEQKMKGTISISPFYI